MHNTITRSVYVTPQSSGLGLWVFWVILAVIAVALLLPIFVRRHKK
jgi:hypothetical protein